MCCFPNIYGPNSIHTQLKLNKKNNVLKTFCCFNNAVSHQKVWPPLSNQRFWQFASLAYTGVCVNNLPSGGYSKFMPRSYSAKGREIAKIPRATSQTLQTSVNMLSVKVHDSISRKRLKKDPFLKKKKRCQEKTLFYLKITRQHGLGLHLSKP